MNMPQFKIDPWLGGKKAAAALTFDDWTPGQAQLALPLLNRMQLKATFFVTLSNFGIRPNEDHWWTLQQLLTTGHEIGNHTITHCDLSSVTPLKLFSETTYAKEIFEDNLIGEPLKTFAYPFGKYNPLVISELQKQHLAARSYSDTNDNLNFDYHFVEDEADYFKIVPVRANAQLSEVELEDLVNRYTSNHGLMTCVFHGVFNEENLNDQGMFDAIHEKKLESLVRVLDSKREDIWITTFGNAISYHRYVNSLDYRMTMVKDQILRVDIVEKEFDSNRTSISAFIGFYNNKIPVAVTHRDKALFVDYAKDGIRVFIDSEYIDEPLFIHYQ